MFEREDDSDRNSESGVLFAQKLPPGFFTRKILSVAQSRPFDLLVFPFWSSLSHGPKRLAFYFWVLWASEFLEASHSETLGRGPALSRHSSGRPTSAPSDPDPWQPPPKKTETRQTFWQKEDVAEGRQLLQLEGHHCVVILLDNPLAWVKDGSGGLRLALGKKNAQVLSQVFVQFIQYRFHLSRF